jgi:uncharacterized membrane protein YfcA
MDLSTSVIIVSFASIITSAITAITGMGGGVLLLAILPSVLPAKAVIPVHGAAQLSSNFSRFILDVKNTCVKPVLLFTAGSVFGAYFGTFLLAKIDLEMIPLFVSLFIISIIWLPVNKLLNLIPGKYFSLGIVQTAISLYVGATGPLSTSVLISDKYSSSQVIVSNAAINTVQNIMKLTVFFVLGFAFSDYYLHILAMMVCTTLGSYLGSKVRKRFNEQLVKMVLKVVITLFCIKNIVVFLNH